MEVLYKIFDWQGNNLNLYNLFKDYRNCFILDSSLNANNRGRFSFIGFEPFEILNTKNENSFSKLKNLLESYSIENNFKLSPFLGGAVGYLSYDIAQILEKKIKLNAKDDLMLPDFYFGFYDTIIAIDRISEKLIVLSTGFPEKKDYFRRIRAKERLQLVINKLSAKLPGGSAAIWGGEKIEPFKERAVSKNKIGAIGSNFSKENYLKAVNKSLEFIKKGDIYQVNLSQRFSLKTKVNGFSLFKNLREISPANFSAYFDAGNFQIISSSPERFLKVCKRIVETVPMKGTRPRGRNTKEDAFFREDLLNSKKDRAELLMIVDLLRNDLGRVCNYGSIKVTKKRSLEKYNTVFQTTATIMAKLHKNKDNIDLIMAAHPGGSVTGCPKIRAIEIIDSLEPTRRAIYTGSFGYLSFSGNIDLNILIRTFLKKKDDVYFQVGGGIVADSKPELEYEETLTKAKALTEALNLCS